MNDQECISLNKVMSADDVIISDDSTECQKLDVKASLSMANPASQKLLTFKAILAERYINEGKLRNLASSGISDDGNLRATVWRLLMRFLPFDTESWPEYHALKMKEYEDLKKQYVSPPKVKDEIDHPLCLDSGSKWNQWHQDIQLMEEIEKDVSRTHPDISLFVVENAANSSIHQSLSRILFIYAKQNPEIKYVQGMNELAGTLLFVFSKDEGSFQSSAECDTYFCFSGLVDENRGLYMRSRDHEEDGLHSRIDGFVSLLRRHDPEVYALLQEQGLDPSFFGLRWITTLLSREFNLADAIRLWDSLLADTNRQEWLDYFCATMVMEVREQLIAGDFAANLQLLQSYPDSDLRHLLHRATAVRATDYTVLNTSVEERDGDVDGAGSESDADDGDDSPSRLREVWGGVVLTAGKLLNDAASSRLVANIKASSTLFEGYKGVFDLSGGALAKQVTTMVTTANEGDGDGGSP